MKKVWNQIRGVLTRRERRRMAKLMLGDVIISLLDIVFLAALLFIVNFYTQPDRVSMPLHLPGRLLQLWGAWVVGVLFVLYCIKNTAGFMIYRSQCRFVGDVASRISEDRLEAYLRGPFTGYVGVDSAVHIRRTAHEPVEFGQHILAGVQQLVTQSVLILLSVAALLFFNAHLFLWLLLVLMPPVALVFRMIRVRLRSVKEEAQHSMVGTLRHLQEAVAGYVEGNVYGRERFFLARYGGSQRRFNRYFSELLIIQGIPNRMMELFVMLGLLALVLVRTYSGGGGSAVLTIGAFMAAAYKIIPGLIRLLTIAGQIRTYMYTVEGGEHSPVGHGAEASSASTAIRRMELREVSFGYAGRDRIVDRLSFAIDSGDFIGLTGISGKGKTTIMNMLLGFLEPMEGTVVVNGRKIGRRDHRRIAYVKQQPFIIGDSILRNILLEEGEPDWPRMYAAVEAAGLGPLVASFPEGLDGIVAEQGRNISGGQRQRIAIARALYKDADLVLLDEPFNELDEVSEALLLKHFAALATTGKLVLLITHNKNSLNYCNKIISLDEVETSYAGHPVTGFSCR